jgi:hypothetical protein
MFPVLIVFLQMFHIDLEVIYKDKMKSLETGFLLVGYREYFNLIRKKSGFSCTLDLLDKLTVIANWDGSGVFCN